MKELTMNEVEQVNGGLAPLVGIGIRVAVGIIMIRFSPKAY
ncbi:class IIb bacteriocin, lactobin A/cerein 7B family [Microbulbifer spongiae]|uniref:Class IIb bacteriocin, lactobin A/cerein 7B family n=1 Tax=Microbulbifer spongiae TaxID=2944933 RepID=A0ABY9E9V8_9GAMM|nr:class IIb bacteriocin, lactobin A/cerein 7B family [Microbulbifer sp. MI-G]WKD49467.1 class IIb bacteriocin, lactobin A/cerein 7B family [Microbulbifer sp. MI-G]